MKRKNVSLLKLKKNKISNLNLVSSQLGGFNSEDTTATTGSETNPNYSLTCYTEQCGETETCETECGGCNTNGNTGGVQSPSVINICKAIGTLLGC